MFIQIILGFIFLVSVIVAGLIGYGVSSYQIQKKDPDHFKIEFEANRDLNNKVASWVNDKIKENYVFNRKKDTVVIEKIIVNEETWRVYFRVKEENGEESGRREERKKDIEQVTEQT